MTFVFIRSFLFATCCSFVIQSCCKENCSDENIFAIDFQGFTASEVEKIKILSYNENNFTIPLDSYYVSSNNIIKKDTTRVYPDKPLLSDFNFQIIVETAGLNYSLSDFQTKKENCHCGSGTYKIVTGYKLNGAQYSGLNGNPLVIKK